MMARKPEKPENHQNHPNNKINMVCHKLLCMYGKLTNEIMKTAKTIKTGFEHLNELHPL